MSFFDYQGTEIVRDNVSGFDPWAVTDETAPSDMSTLAGYGAEDFVTNVYDALKTAYPTYITKSVIGKDATDTYNIYQYIFEPDYPEQTIYFQAGVHGNEPDSWIGLGNLMRLICNHWEEHEWLAYLRWKCRIIVIPIVNVWGVSNNKTRFNANDVNLNRDLNDAAAQETVVMKANIAALKSAYDISFCLDFHTTESANWGGDAAIGCSSTAKNVPITSLVAKSIAKKHCPDRLASYVSAHSLAADELYLPFWFNTSNDGTYVKYFMSLGYICSTIEYGDYVYSDSLANAKTGRICLDVYANHVIGLAMQKYNVA